MAKVRLSGPAMGYLKKEAHYLRQRSQPAAEAFLARMREARKNLGRFPRMGFEKEGLPVSGSRSLIVGDYILDYDLHGEDVYITAIRPGQKPEITVEVTEDFDYEDDEEAPPPPGKRREKGTLPFSVNMHTGSVVKEFSADEFKTAFNKFKKYIKC